MLYLVTQLCLTLWDRMDCSSPGSSVCGDSSGKNTGVGCHFLLQGIFLTQGSNPGLPHCLAHSKCYIRILLFTQSCLTLFNPMDCSTPGFPVLHHLLELAQTHVHCVSDAIQPSHPLPSPSPPAFNLSQRQGLFQ